MSRAFSFVLMSFSLVTLLLIMEIFLLSQRDNAALLKKKYATVAFIGLPDLALSNEPYLRHRSLSSIFAIYSIDGALREYEKESFLLSKGLK